MKNNYKHASKIKRKLYSSERKLKKKTYTVKYLQINVKQFNDERDRVWIVVVSRSEN